MIARDTPTRKRKPLPRPKPKPSARGPQGLPTANTSPARKVAPPKRKTGPAAPMPKQRGPQGLPGPRKVKPTPSIKKARKQELERRERVQERA